MIAGIIEVLACSMPRKVKQRPERTKLSGSKSRAGPTIQNSLIQWQEFIEPVRARIELIARTRWRLSKSQAHDIAFHLTDWENELYDLGTLFYHGGSLTDEQAESLLTSFLIHAPNHIAAAARLAGFPVRDIFKKTAGASHSRRVAMTRKRPGSSNTNCSGATVSQRPTKARLLRNP
jgi:hypothetical protein